MSSVKFAICSLLVVMSFSGVTHAESLIITNGSIRVLTDWVTKKTGKSFIYQEGIDTKLNLNIEDAEKFKPLALLESVLISSNLSITYVNGVYLVSEESGVESNLLMSDPRLMQVPPGSTKDVIEPFDYPMSIQVYRVSSANLDHVTQTLLSVLPTMQTEESLKFAHELPSFTAYASALNESVVVTVPSYLHPKIDRLISQLDIKQKQVLVEAVIYETSDLHQEALGFNFRNLKLFEGLKVDFGVSPSTAFTVPGLGISYSSGASIKALLNALNSDDTSRVLSTPSLRVLDLQNANIDVGQEVPFITTQQVNDEGRTVNTIERKNVGLSLSVRPQIYKDDITLTVRMTTGSISTDTVASDLITNNRTMNTSITVKDGEMVYLGGLIIDEKTLNKMGIPVLQDIPILGYAFKDRKNKSNQRKLSIFIKTTLINT